MWTRNGLWVRREIPLNSHTCEIAVTDCHYCRYGVHIHECRQYIPAYRSTTATLQASCQLTQRTCQLVMEMLTFFVYLCLRALRCHVQVLTWQVSLKTSILNIKLPSDLFLVVYKSQLQNEFTAELRLEGALTAYVSIRLVGSNSRLFPTISPSRETSCNVCVCVRVCMYVCVHVCMYVWMYICTYVCVYTCMYVCVCICVCLYVCVYTCMYVCVYVYVCMYVCMYICMYVRMYVCFFIYLSMLHYVCNTTCYNYLHFIFYTLYTYVILFVC